MNAQYPTLTARGFSWSDMLEWDLDRWMLLTGQYSMNNNINAVYHVVH